MTVGIALAPGPGAVACDSTSTDCRFLGPCGFEPLPDKSLDQDMGQTAKLQTGTKVPAIDYYHVIKLQWEIIREE